MTGSIIVVGIGPGAPGLLTPDAQLAIEKADLVLGYKTYINLIRDLLAGKVIVSSGMRQETERCRQALEAALQGKEVVLVSSGDPGVYGMAGLMYEMAAGTSVQVTIVPGITAACAAAALLGAPLMHDFAVISLSDLLTEPAVIARRVESAAKADFVICLYNPASRTREEPFRACCRILVEYRSPFTPVGIVRNVYRQDQSILITRLDELASQNVDMLTIIIVGNSCTNLIDGKMVTPRGYKL